MFLVALLIALWAYLTWQDERDARVEAESNLSLILHHSNLTTCYFSKHPASFIMVGDSEANLSEALLEAAAMADKQRLILKIGRKGIVK